MSGVKADDACKTEFDLMKKNKAYFGVVFRISKDLSRIEVDKLFPNETGTDADTEETEYKKFADYLKECESEKECRYACYDVRWRTAGGGQRDKLVFITYCGENASTKQKMLYCASKDSLYNSLKPPINHQANDADDLELTNLIKIAKSHTTSC